MHARFLQHLIFRGEKDKKWGKDKKRTKIPKNINIEIPQDFDFDQHQIIDADLRSLDSSTVRKEEEQKEIIGKLIKDCQEILERRKDKLALEELKHSSISSLTNDDIKQINRSGSGELPTGRLSAAELMKIIDEFERKRNNNDDDVTNNSGGSSQQENVKPIDKKRSKKRRERPSTKSDSNKSPKSTDGTATFSTMSKSQSTTMSQSTISKSQKMLNSRAKLAKVCSEMIEREKMMSKKSQTAVTQATRARSNSTMGTSYHYSTILDFSTISTKTSSGDMKLVIEVPGTETMLDESMRSIETTALMDLGGSKSNFGGAWMCSASCGKPVMPTFSVAKLESSSGSTQGGSTYLGESLISTINGSKSSIETTIAASKSTIEETVASSKASIKSWKSSIGFCTAPNQKSTAETPRPLVFFRSASTPGRESKMRDSSMAFTPTPGAYSKSSRPFGLFSASSTQGGISTMRDSWAAYTPHSKTTYQTFKSSVVSSSSSSFDDTLYNKTPKNGDFITPRHADIITPMNAATIDTDYIEIEHNSLTVDSASPRDGDDRNVGYTYTVNSLISPTGTFCGTRTCR